MSSDLPDLQQAINCGFPIRAAMSILAGPIETRLDDLYPEEHSVVSDALEKRQFEFATGRRLARRALADLDLPSGAISRGAKREPVWPPGSIGSITHADQWAAVCVARDDVYQSVGIDLEISDRVGTRLHRKLFTEAERRQIAQRSSHFAGLLFSAKEAVYKATFPIVRRYIGFQEAEVSVDEGRRQFTFRYLGDHDPTRIMETGVGHYLIAGPYVLSFVSIPSRTE